MEVSDEEYSKYINKIANDIFVNAISNGVDNYAGGIDYAINNTTDILDVVFPTRSNLVMLYASIKRMEQQGIVLTVYPLAQHTNEVFNFKELPNEK